ncbi:MAG: glycosyltransferase family 2 protein [Pyrinomonadaceae bacterium]
MKPPVVYIVTLNWNGLSDTLECLASLEKLTYKHIRKIVVDNGSRRNEGEIIKEKFPDVTVIRNDDNLGFCGGCNTGINHAVGEGADFVLLINNDAMVSADLIEKLMDGFLAVENPGAVSPIVCEYPDTTKVSYARPLWLPRSAYFILKEENDTLELLNQMEPYEVDFASGCCMLVPTAVYRDAGLLDERYFAYYDEVEWCYRIRQKGYKSYVVPTTSVQHKERQSTPDSVHYYLINRNRMLWMKQYLPFGQRVRPLLFLAKDCLWHVLNIWGLTEPRILKQHSRAAVRGYRDYFLGRFYKWDDKTQKETLET